MKKNRIGLILIIALLLQLLSGAASAANSNEDQYIDQTEALTAYQKILSHFEVDDSGNTVYPDYYGGEFIDRDVLCIYLVQNDKEHQNLILSYCDQSSYVSFLSAEYSLNYLESLNNVVSQYVNEYDITGYGTDRRNNCFTVQISPSAGVLIAAQSEEVIKNTNIIPNLEDAPIEYIVEDYAETYATKLYGGAQVNSSTLGICGTYNGSSAILLAGHAVSYYGTGISVANIKYNNSTSFATTKYCQFANNGYGDFAIATINSSSFTTTNKVYGTASSNLRSIIGTAYSGNTPVGTTLYKYGNTCGYAVGTVTALNQSITYSTFGSNVTVKGLNTVAIKVSSGYSVAGGDSGGPVYISSSGYKLVGTISGGPSSNSNATVNYYYYYSPIYYAENAGFSVKTS